jgi:hypothetical protein
MAHSTCPNFDEDFACAWFRQGNVGSSQGLLLYGSRPIQEHGLHELFLPHFMTKLFFKGLGESFCVLH